MLDVLIRNGKVVDGSGAPWVRADVGIEGGRIAAAGNLEHAQAAREIDAGGKVVAPGFIDCHSHSDWSLLANRGADSTLMMGVTTEVVGNCGMSYAPVSALNRDRIATDVARTSPGVGVEWTSFGQYLDHVRKGGGAGGAGSRADEPGGIGANYAFLV